MQINKKFWPWTSKEAANTALVLSGGGARGAYQTGVLAAIGERSTAPRPFPIVTGVSAGSINTAYLAAYRGDFLTACRDLSRAWLHLSLPHVFRTDAPFFMRSGLGWTLSLLAGGRFAPKMKGILDTSPLREYLSSGIDFSAIQENIDNGFLRAVALSATSYSTGRTMTFVQGKDDIPMWKRAGRESVRAALTVDHVLASSALPIIFPAIRIEGEYFGDGSIRQNTPLAPAVHLGASRILVISVRYQKTEAEEEEHQIDRYPPPGQIGGMLLNAVFLDSLETDAERLERVNRTLDFFPNRRRHPEGLRKIRFLMLRPSQDLGKLATHLERDLPRPFRGFVRALGVQNTKTPDLLSYLLFERHYVERLIELGYNDTIARWGEIAEFLGDGES